MNIIKTIFRIPSGIPVLGTMIVIFIRHMYNMGILEATQYWESDEFKEKIVKMEKKSWPYEMAFNTICWLIVLKYLVMICI